MRWATAFVALLLGLGALGWFALAVVTPGGGSASASASLACSVKNTDCNTGAGEVEVFRMSSNSNAHARTPGVSSYGYRVCCGGVTGLDDNCSGTYATVLRLSAADNAHVQSSGSYPTEVCLSAGTAVVGCMLAGSCTAGYTCLATASGTDNAHVADCNGVDDYATKVCCYAGSALPTPVSVGGIAELPEVSADSSGPNYVALAGGLAAALLALSAGAWYVRRRWLK
jgi:hypothetical protein